ncbi:MAG: ABC transporter ATP-binding protein [Armatimonadetes bacterium]|nr:ABC transporter ATP-binding protein [Armatimonadota bacterium]
MSEATAPVIETSGLTKRFGKRVAVDGLDLTVGRGAIFGFLGPNGAGKSTTIRMLLGLLRPDGGEARVLGARIPQQRLRIAGRVGAQVEGPAFYDYLSGRQNLDLLARLSGGCERRRVDEVLELVRLRERQHDRVGAYSHGMKQRLGIAQALLPKPELIILDEPGTGLDPQGLVEVRELMRHLRDAEGLTVFLSSHLLHEVELICTEVAVVAQGRLVRSGTVDELLARSSAQADVQVDDMPRAAQVAEALPYVTSTETRDGWLRVSLNGDLLPELNRDLVAAGVRVSGLAPARSSLEEIYLTLMAENGNAGGPAR